MDFFHCIFIYSNCYYSNYYYIFARIYNKPWICNIKIIIYRRKT